MYHKQVPTHYQHYSSAYLNYKINNGLYTKVKINKDITLARTRKSFKTNVSRYLKTASGTNYDDHESRPRMTGRN